MIKHLHFAYTEHLGGGVVIDIEVKSGIVTAEVSSVFHNTPNTEVSFDEETSAKWLAELDNLRTDKWKRLQLAARYQLRGRHDPAHGGRKRVSGQLGQL